MTQKVVKARIVKGGTDWKKSVGDPHFGRGRVFVTFEDGSEKEAFGYYLDELSFEPEQFIGKTLDEVYEIRHKADVAYLRS